MGRPPPGAAINRLFNSHLGYGTSNIRIRGYGSSGVRGSTAKLSVSRCFDLGYRARNGFR